MTEMERVPPFEYRAVIPAAKIRGPFQYFLEASDEKQRRTTWPPGGGAQPVSVTVTADDQPPLLHFVPVVNAETSRPLRIVADVADPSGVKWVHLRYRGLSQQQDFRTLPMLPTGKRGEGEQYEAIIPAGDIDAKFDLMYLFEVMDGAGNGKIYPDLDKETPYVVVRLKQSR